MSELDLASQEVKDAIASAVADATEGLKAKNNELLGKLKKAQAGQSIDPAEYAALETERDDLRSKLADANKAVGKATKAAEEAVKKAADTDAAFNRTLTDQQLTEALTKHGVTNPVHLKAAKALIASSGGVQVVDDNGNRVVKVGDKSVADHITEWASGDEGKHFVTAPDTTGGGSHGGRGPGSKTISQSDFNARSAKERAQLMSDGYTLTP